MVQVLFLQPFGAAERPRFRVAPRAFAAGLCGVRPHMSPRRLEGQGRTAEVTCICVPYGSTATVPQVRYVGSPGADINSLLPHHTSGLVCGSIGGKLNGTTRSLEGRLERQQTISHGTTNKFAMTL